jgi:phage shock protein C
MPAYCSSCGTALPNGARFCSSCGKEVFPAGAAAYSAPSNLMRPRTGRKIAGVCQGLANQYAWDVTWTRVIAALLGVFTFPVGVLAYVLFWLIMPEEPMLVPAPTVPATTAIDTVS